MGESMRILKAFSGFAAVLAAAVVLQACPPAYPKCEGDTACKEHGESCVQGQCQQCAVDKNCPANFVCQANKCVPKPECKTDGDCGGKKCEAGKCSDKDAQTSANACDKCAADEECRDDACVKKNSS